MKLSEFDYNLPKELIAQFPLKKRDSARLLVLNRKEKKIEHRTFPDILDYFNKGDLVVLNDTKVLSSRLEGRRLTGGKVEVLLINCIKDLTFRVLIKSSRVNIGERIIFNKGECFGTVESKDRITFKAKDIESIYNLGVMPLPPYIKRTPELQDTVYYQTVYAKRDGAIAAPTAGLHFTKQLIQDMQSCQVNIAYLTLHVGLATFRPVKSEDITRHKMEPEYFEIEKEAIELIEKTRQEKKHIFATGTTTLRALETYALHNIKQGNTDLFIYPGYKFKIVDTLLTNFHLPRTTLFMLVCAFAGTELIKEAYQEAIRTRYRFYSYGDAMLIL